MFSEVRGLLTVGLPDNPACDPVALVAPRVQSLTRGRACLSLISYSAFRLANQPSTENLPGPVAKN